MRVPRTKRTQLLVAAAFLAPILAATVLIVLLNSRPPAEIPVGAPSVNLEPVKARSSESLADLFSSMDYQWPPQEPLPPAELRTLPHDLDQQAVSMRKSLFFRALAPLIAAENARIFRQRQQLKSALQRLEADPTDAQAEIALLSIAEEYGMDVRGEIGEIQHELLWRVDIIPPGLVLAQAANESAWGTSRFAREANNLFGMWTWDKSKGIKPKQRAEDATHYIRIFSDLRSAVRNYLHTLNTGAAYSDLRNIRARARQQGNAPSAVELAAGLERYSQRGKAYVNEIREMIRYNELEQWPRFELRESVQPIASGESTSD